MSYNNMKDERFSNDSADRMKKAQETYQYLYKAKYKSEKLEILRAIVIAGVMFVLAIGVIGKYGLSAYGTENNGNTNNTPYASSTTQNPTAEGQITEGSSTEDQAAQDTTTEKNNQGNSVEYVAEGNTADYSKYQSASDFATLKTESGDTIVYPKNFFSSVSIDNGIIAFSADGDYPEYNIYTESSEYSDPIEEVKNRISRYSSQMDKITYRHPENDSKMGVASDGYSKNVLMGLLDESQNIGVYYVIASNGTTTKILEFKYETDPSAREDHSNQDYIVDCLYRGATFSGSTKSIRSRDDFMSN